MGKEPEEIRQEIEETRARMGDTVEAIGYKADVKSRAKESIAEKKESVVESARNVKDRVVGSIAGTKESVSESVSGARQSAASTIGEKTPSREDVKQRTRRAAGVAQENPLGLALGSFAAGFLAGMLVPSTKIEEEKLAPVATQVRETAVQTGQEALDRGKQVAQETTQIAQEAAQEAVQRTTEKAKERAQQQSEELASSAKERMQQGSSEQGSTFGGRGIED